MSLFGFYLNSIFICARIYKCLIFGEIYMLKNIIFIISLAFFAFVNVAIAGTQTSTPSATSTQNADTGATSGSEDSDSEDSDEEMDAEDEDTLEVSAAWARASLSSNNNSAAYMSINNPTDKQITILGASAATVANNVELHKSFVDEKGVSRMTSIDKIVVPANSTISLAPGGIHIMLFDLKRKLNPGDSFKIVLAVEGMDAIIVDAEVK